MLQYERVSVCVVLRARSGIALSSLCVLQRVAVCCIVLRCVAVCCSVDIYVSCSALQSICLLQCVVP